MIPPAAQVIQLAKLVDTSRQIIISNNPEEQKEAVALLKHIIEHNEHNDEACEIGIKTAIEAMHADDEKYQIIAYEIFESLFKINQGFIAAKNTACETILSEKDTRSTEIKAHAFKLFQLLVDYNHGTKEAKYVIHYGRNHDDKYIRAGAIMLHNHVRSKKQSKL
jgi:hypothetical protein